MFQKISPKVFLAVAIIIALVVFELLVHKPFLGTARDRITELLQHASGRVNVKGDSIRINSKEFLAKYFDAFGYKQTWTDTTHETDKYREMLLQMLNHADSLGLDRKDYHQDYISRFDSLSHLPHFDYAQYESENELIFTDAAVSFLYHVAYGKELNIGFNGVKYNIDSARILGVLQDLLVHKDWRRTLDSLEPKTKPYRALKAELNRMSSILQTQPGLDSAQAGTTGSGKNILTAKLKAYGIIADSVTTETITDQELKNAVKAFQKMMSTDTSGKADDKTLALLNFPLQKRIQQIKESLNYWRWTGRLREREFILVNIPAARLQIIRSDSAENLGMKVIVGKQSTQTPQFTAYINKVITYPYWVVPFSIATKEMLPKIRRKLSYLEDNNLQVINGKGEVVDPQTVGWGRFSEKYFPYTLRQSTGCDNSLGVLKFDLNSPYSIYLHDTNARGLFGKKDRFLSHGCIRLEKPMVLAEYVLKTGLDTATANKLNDCMANQKPAEFPLKRRLPVLIFYMTADIDELGNLKFYNDVYGVENPTEKKAI